MIKNIRPKRACSLLRRVFGVGARARSSRPARKLTLAALVLAVATFGVVPTVAQAQQDCAAISALTLTSDTPGVLDVSWDAPTGAAPTDYRVNWARSGEDYPPWTDDTANLHPTTTSQQLTDLDEGVEYKVRVRARYHDGARAKNPCSGPWAETTRQVAAQPVVPVQQPVVPVQQPVVQVQQDDGAISALTLTSDTPGTLDVSWDAPTGAAPTDYRVNWARSGEDYPPWTDNTANLHPTTTSQQLTDLDEDVEYKVRVRARYHDGPWSGPWAEATRQVASQPSPVVRSADDPPVTLEPPELTVIEPDDPDDPLVAPQQSTDGPVIELDTDEPDDPPVTLEPPQLTVIEPDTDDADDPDDPLVALQQSDGSVSEPADGDLPADTTTDGLLIVDGNGVTGRHTDNVTDRHLDSDGNRHHSISPHLYSAEDVDWYAVDLEVDVYYQFDVKHNGGNLPVFRLKIYDSAGNPAMVTTGIGDDERQVASDNNFGVPGNLPDQRNALPFTTTTAGRYYVSISAPKGGIAPDRVYTLSVQSDDHPNDPTTTADVAVGGSIRTYIMRTWANASSTDTDDADAIKVALQANTRYRFVWDVACLHEGAIGIFNRDSEIFVDASISRETDGWCTDLTVEFTPPVGGDYFISVTARGSDFPGKSRYAFQGVWGTLTVIGPGLTVRFGDGSYTATEGGTEATVEVILSEDPERPVTVPLEVTELGGATAGDYTGLPESVTFTAGQTTTSFIVTAVDDTADDDDESIRIGFGTPPAGVTAASPDSTTVSLADNDYPEELTVRFGDGPYTATEGGTEATVEVILSEDPERPVTVPLEVTELGGATAGDYTELPESVTFTAGQTTASFMVTAVDDTANDDDESIRIGFGTLPAGVTAASPDSTTVSLADNDYPELTVRFGDGPYTATEGGTEATVEVILSEDPERTVSVTVQAALGTALTEGDFTLNSAQATSTQVTFTAEQTTATFTVAAVDDILNEGEEELLLKFGTLPPGVTEGIPFLAFVTVVDNDLQPVTVRFDAASYTATEGGSAATVLVRLSEDPERPVTVPLEVTELVGATAGDYTGLPESVTFNAGDTSTSFMVTAVDDTVDDDGESITIGFGTPLPTAVTAADPETTTVSLADNDNSPARGDPLPRGERKVGATLTADTSGITDADGLTGVVLAYRWQHVDGGTPADITGAMSDTYTLTADDLGKRIQLQVQFTDDNNSTETLTGPATSLVVAEPRLLVGNFDSQSGVNSTLDRSNGFVTGTHPLGYAIDSIQMKRNRTTSVSSAFGEFHLYDSTVNSDRLLRKPASRLVTVTGPDRVSDNTLTFAPSKVKLDPDTTYHAVLTRSQGGMIGCNLAGSGLDSGSLAGFSIIPRSYQYQGSGGWLGACGLKIHGFELVSSSFVERVEFTSSPALAGMYATGEAIEATVTLSEAVTFADPSPVLLLQVGDNEREMAYVASASTATSWVFRYTVAAGDRDDGGVSLERNALRGHADADLSHRGIGDDRTRRVNATPLVVSRRVTSRPVAPSWYGPGEKIEFTVEFSLPVTVSGDPELEFNVTTPAGGERATYESGSGTTELVFSYTVGTGDDDSDGIWWGADSLLLDGGDSITGVYNSVAAVLDHSQVGFLTSHRIDQNPRAVSQKVTSDPTHGTNSDTYGAGDIITFEVVFNQTVTVTGAPQLRFSVTGPGDEYADYTGGSGTNTLAFSYTVLATETDPDGIYLYRNPLTLETGESILGTANNLPPEGDIGKEGPLSGHKIDGSITN